MDESKWEKAKDEYLEKCFAEPDEPVIGPSDDEIEAIAKIRARVRELLKKDGICLN